MAQDVKHGSPSKAEVGRGPFDVAIVGAGAAGIAAGRRLRKEGKSFVILEARDRVAGRAYTDNDAIPDVPVDLGAEWFIEVEPNGNRTTNPLYDLAAPHARKLGIFLDDQMPVFFGRPRQWLPPAQKLIPALLESGLLQASIATYGAFKDENPELKDLSVDELATLAGLRSSEWYDFATRPLVNQYGAPPSKLSVYDISLVMRSERSGKSYLIGSGMGNFVRSLADGLPFQLSTPVETIHWKRGAGVHLDTGSGVVEAKTAIITVPVSVLAAKDPKPVFDPQLPSEYTEAFHALPFGTIEKVWLSYSENIFGTADKNFVAERLSGTTPGYQVHWLGKNAIAVIVGGDIAETAARQGKQGLIDYAKKAVAEIFGNRTPDKCRSAACSGWLMDPYSKGAYSNALPGKVAARRLLGNLEEARDSLDKKIFFAGEAAAVAQHSSLPGAWITGEAAAEQAIKAIASTR